MRKTLLILFLLITYCCFAQQYNYQVKITDFNYWMKASGGLCGDAKHIKLWVTFEDNTTNQLFYTSNPYNINKTDFINRFFVKKPKSIHITSYVHEEDWFGWCNGYTASISNSSGTLSYVNGIASGTITDYDNGGDKAIIDVKFNYEVSTVVKNYTYKVEYDIDLHNKSLLAPRMEFDGYFGSYDISLKTEIEGKNVYSDFITGNLTAPLEIKKAKYDSIVRFMGPLKSSIGSMDIRFRTTSLLKCEGQVDDPRFSTIKTSVNTGINGEQGCISHKDLFPSCGTAKINYFNMYRIYENLGDIEANKANFGSDGKSPELSVCEPFRVYVNDCNEPSSYEVLYSTDNLNFKTLLPYARRENYFDLNYSSLEGVKVGEKVYIMFKYYKDADCEKNPYLCTKATGFKIFFCPPILVGEPEPIKTKCFYSKDGRVKVNFDRQLDGENLVVSVRFKQIGTTDYHLYDQEDTTVLDENPDGTYSYTWIGKDKYLDPDGEYIIKYQTLKGATNTIPEEEASWSLIKEVTNPFTIPKATNVNFKATHLNDESCFNSGDGKIQLEVTSGETSSYKYIIYKVEGTTETLYRNWITFTGNSTIIENLEKNKYRIKVQDSNNCFARNP